MREGVTGACSARPACSACRAPSHPAARAAVQSSRVPAPAAPAVLRRRVRADAAATATGGLPGGSGPSHVLTVRGVTPRATATALRVMPRDAMALA